MIGGISRGSASQAFDRHRFAWVTVGMVAVALLVGAIPGATGALQYDRTRVAAGDVWRPFTAQLVHWSPRMALLDLGAVLLLGAWLERGGRRRLVGSVLLAVATVGVGIHTLAPWVHTYRGASGLAMALATLVAVDASATPGPRRMHALGCMLLAALAAKLAWEWSTGKAIAAGPLPAGVVVLPLAHLLGVGAGVAAGLVHRRGRVAAAGTGRGRIAMGAGRIS